MIWLAKLLGLWGWLKQAAVSAFKWALGHPWQAALIVAVCGLFWQHRAIGERDATIAQQTALIAEMQAKAKAARANQEAVNHAPVIITKAIAEKSNAEAPAYYRRVADVANANRVQGSCKPGIASLRGADSPTQEHDGPVAPAEMVARPREDDDLIIAAAARAAKMHQDALEMIEAGVAVKSD